MINKLLTLMALSTYVIACPLDSNSSQLDISVDQGLALRTFTLNGDFESDNLTAIRTSYNNRIEAKIYNIGIHSDIDIYDINRPLGKLHNVSLAFEDAETNLQTGYQINALYLSLELGDNFTLYHGAIPFKGGRFSEIKDPTINGGNGLAIINNQVYSSDFVSFHDDTQDGRYSIIAGKSEFNTKNKYNGLLTKNEGSSGTYILATYETGKHFFEADYYDMTVKMYDLDYADLKIGGLGYIYDDSTSSGVTLYTNIGVSEISEDVVGLMTQYKITNPAVISYMKNRLNAHTTNTNDVKGYAGLFGANYEFDTYGKTFNIGSEFFITRGGWVSANHGVAFLSDHSWYANRNAIESSVYVGCDITKDLRVSSKFVHTDAKSVPNAFSISQNSDQSTGFNGSTFTRRFNKLEFLINYTF